MDYFQEYLFNSTLNYSLEISACLAGTYYLKKKFSINRANRFFLYFLWLTLFFEIIGAYAPIAYFTKYEYFGFVKDTVYMDNSWLYNVFSLIYYTFLSYYFMMLLKSHKVKLALRVLILLFILIGIINLIISDVFFIGDSLYTSTIGSLLLLFTIILFYFELLKSDKIIDLKRYLPIYISVGILIYTLCTTPLDIFSKYFNAKNDLFVKTKTIILLLSNIIMYTTFIIGFLVCTKSSKNKKELIDY